TGNQWLLNGSPIGGQTNPSLNATAAGDYSVRVTDGNGCSATSATITVVVNASPNATITAPGSMQTGTTGNTASVANAGTGTTCITFTAGAVGTLTLNITVTNSAGCSDSKSANVNVTATSPGLTITSVVPPAGKTTGGKSVTVNGTGFVSGATVTFGGN